MVETGLAFLPTELDLGETEYRCTNGKGRLLPTPPDPSPPTPLLTSTSDEEWPQKAWAARLRGKNVQGEREEGWGVGSVFETQVFVETI